MYRAFFIHSPLDGHLGCFHVLSIVNGWKQFMLPGGLAPRTSYTSPLTSLTCHLCAEDVGEDSLAEKLIYALIPEQLCLEQSPNLYLSSIMKDLGFYNTHRITGVSATVSWILEEDTKLLSQKKKTLLFLAKSIARASCWFVSIFLVSQFYSGNTGHGRDVSTCSELHYKKGTLNLGNLPLLL